MTSCIGEILSLITPYALSRTRYAGSWPTVLSTSLGGRHPWSTTEDLERQTKPVTVVCEKAGLGSFTTIAYGQSMDSDTTSE